jgi:hypothetical protein
MLMQLKNLNKLSIDAKASIAAQALKHRSSVNPSDPSKYDKDK